MILFMRRRDPPSQKECRYVSRAGQTSLSLTRFIENISSIYISEEVYYENIFSNSSNNTNYVS
jgi:hypothetical protein